MRLELELGILFTTTNLTMQVQVQVRVADQEQGKGKGLGIEREAHALASYHMSENLKAQICTVGGVNNQTERTHPKVEWDNWNGRTGVKKAGGCETGGRR